MRKFSLQSPENVSFEFELAGPGRRLCALMLDFILIISITLAVMLLVTKLLFVFFDFEQAGQWRFAIHTLLAFLLTAGYYSFYEWKTGGQSFGKKIVGIRVIRDIGVRMTLYHIIVRNLFRAVDILPLGYALGGLFCFFHPHQKRLGDFVAGTVVVVERKPVLPDQIMKVGDRYNSLAEDGILARKIRNAIGPREKQFLVDLCSRREQLEDKTRLKLFSEVANHYRQRLAIQQLETMSDERLVQNLTSIVMEGQSFQRK